MYDVKAMDTGKDFYWRNDGFTWTGGYSKQLPDTKKNWKVFYFNMLDQHKNPVGVRRREYIRTVVTGNIQEEYKLFYGDL